MNAPRTEQFLTLQEIVAAARARLAPGPWSYLIGGAESEITVRRNRQALDSIAFRPRVLRDVSRIDTGAAFLGRRARLPVLLAPIGGLESFVEGGAASAARGAAQFGVPQMLSSVCQPGLEETAAAADTLRCFQLYVRGDEAWVDDHVRRARDHGFTAFCLTVDVAMYSRRERDLIGRFVKPWRATAQAGSTYQSGLSWDQVKRFKDKHDLPLIIKGIATAEDAEIAVQHGVEVIYVSNHGGRQLDHGLGSAAVLPEIVAAVAGRAEVWVDGGFMRGTDVVKAIALGAKSVGLGRLPCLGLAAAGVPGLVRTLEILEDEIRTCLGLLGVTSFGELTPQHVTAAPPVGEPGALGAFPLLGESPSG
ncbi:MAG: alpha-hydroxy-acid oxidizing enzyme [Betaproteobacteria bacterium RBG_16_66_20]|nr:MAG: alpha-hydroxy-acid oxidizing enzyme [Betaproteobacteria bacterium RBG_16_66_20]